MIKIKKARETIEEKLKGELLEAQRNLQVQKEELRAVHDELQRTNSELLQLTLELDDRVEERTEALRKSEEELRRHRDHLQERVDERTIELKSLNEQLEQRLRELQASEGRFRGLVVTIPDIVYRIDKEGYFIFINDAVKRLGYDPEELTGRHFSEIILPADVDEVSRSTVLSRYAGKVTGDQNAPKLFDERRTEHRRTVGLEVKLITKDRKREKPGLIESIGEGEVVAEINSSGLYAVSPKGQGTVLVGTVGVIRDISDRKLMEEELRRAYDELEIKVEERTSDLAAAKDELEKAYEELQRTQNQVIQSGRLAALGQLAAGAAHEIRNPVNIISLKLQVLKMTESLPENIQNAFDVCMRQVDRIVKITDGLRKFSRPPEKKMVKRDIRDLIENVVTLSAPRIKTENIFMEVIHDPTIPPVLLDESAFEQVLFNLLSNAMDAINRQEKRLIRIVTEKFDMEEDKCCARVTFSDTGHGIRDEDLNKLFDPFFTTKDPDKGTGIGLSICYGIIHDHEGRIWAENNEWGGASFFIELPVAAGRNEHSEPILEK
jgi:PAS domain S-box-containing protein